jgi:multidrug resistance protein, MATE family
VKQVEAHGAGRERTQQAPRELGPLLRIALPIVVTQLGQMLLGVVDAVFAGRLGVRELDAVTLGNLWQYGTMFPLFGVVLGLDTIASQGHGAGRGDQVALGLQRALLIAGVLSVVIAISWSYTEEALLLLGQDPALARDAATFVGVQRFSAAGFLSYGALSIYLNARGIVRPGIVVMALANLLNALLVWSLGFGHLGLPALGLRGLGIATAITRLLLPVVMVLLIVSSSLQRGAWIPWSRRVFDWAPLKRQLALGLPNGVTLGLEVWAFQVGTLIAGRIGHVALGAHAIALSLASLSYMVPLGFSIGTSARVGQLIGARELGRAETAARTAIGLIASYALCAGLSFAVLRWTLPRLYTGDPAILAAAASVLPIAGAFQLFDGLQAAGSGVLRGMGRPRVTAAFNLVGYFAVGIPLAYHLGLHTSLRLRGVWLGYAAGLAFVAIGLVGTVWMRGPRTVKPLL